MRQRVNAVPIILMKFNDMEKFPCNFTPDHHIVQCGMDRGRPLLITARP